MPTNFTQPEFDKLTVDDLVKNVFVLDSNGKVCMRVMMIGTSVINWGQIGGTLADQVDLQAVLDNIASNITSLQTGKINTVLINAVNGVAGLDGSGKIPASLLPSFVDDVLEYANQAGFPGTGETGKIYVALDTNKVYRWSGSAYVEISASPGTTDALTEGTTNKYFTESRVLNTILTGLSLATSTAIVASDNILQALGKLQAQVTLRALLTTNTFTGNQIISGAATLSVSSGGGSTPDAINIGGGGNFLGQINGDGVLRSGFAAKFFRFRSSTSVDKLTIALDTGNLDSKGSGFFGGDNTASGQMIQANGLNHVYYAWLVNAVRKAYIGFATGASQVFELANEFTNGDINLLTNGTGKVTNNGVPMMTPTGAILQWSTGTAPTGYVLCNGAAISRTTFANLFGVIGTTYGVGDGSTTFNVPDFRGRFAVGFETATSIGTATITIATPGVITLTNHGLSDGNRVHFTTTGALPTGITANTEYFIRDATVNTFSIATTKGGAAIATSGTQSGTHTLFSCNFNVLGETGGEVSHKLSVGELAAHSHSFPDQASNAAANGTINSHGTISNNNGAPTTSNTGGDASHNTLPPYLTVNYIIKS